MAEVVVKFDTVTKKMTATVDGNEVSDVVEASFYGRYAEVDEDPKYGFQLVQYQPNKQEGLST